MKYIFRKKRNVLPVLIFDLVGYFLAKFFKRSFKKAKPEFRNILIIRLDHVGDVLLATAAPKILKENFSRSRIIFLTSSWAAPLLENNPFVDEVILYDAPWFLKKRYGKSPATHNIFNLIRILRKKEIDLALGLRGDMRENLMMFLAGIKDRVGYGITGGGFLLTREVAYQKGVHESVHSVDLLNALDVHHDFLEPKLYFSGDEITRFDQRLEGLGILKDERTIGFLMGAGSPSKEWPVEHLRTFLSDAIRRFPGHKFVLVGTDPYVSLSQKMANAVDLRGKTSLRELCLLIRRSAIFVGSDSGPTHIAAALGVPTVFLYSGTNDFERWRPLAEVATVLRHSVPCSPCYLEACNVKGHPCMSEIKPEEVIKRLEALLPLI